MAKPVCPGATVTWWRRLAVYLTVAFFSFSWGMSHAADRLLAFGYVVWWAGDSWKQQPLSTLDRLMFGDFAVGADGQVANRHGWPGQWAELRAEVRRLGVPLDVSYSILEPAVFNAVFGSAENQRRLMNDMLATVRDSSISGLHLDVEIVAPVAPQARANYHAFVRQLVQAVRQMPTRKLVSAFLTFGADQYLYDGPTAQLFDHAILQGYDAHWKDGLNAGPVAPLTGPDLITWESMRAMALRLGLQNHRVILSFPMYGYEWEVEPCLPRGKRVAEGSITTFAAAPPSVPQVKADVIRRVSQGGAIHDPATGSAYYITAGGAARCTVGWFEDWWTLERKSQWLVNEKLGGLAFFPLGYDQGELVEFFSRRWRPRPPQKP